ncbi:MAG: ClpXP protease specificity-enhancing factor SspB [Mariprofundaceae bacterium]|nr:ClpXP protease specificity-enhancing factor SspB [Mariprofundaceae bacterium]
MSIDFKQKAKAKQLNDYFQSSGRIYIVVDGTADTVDVPEYLKGDPALRLALNVRMRQPIYIRDTGVSSVLSFSGKAHDCFIPLQCIWGAYEPDGDLESGLIWEDAVPEVIRSALLAQNGSEDATASETVDLGIEETVSHDISMVSKIDDIQTRPTKVPHLRVVK